MKGRFSKLLVGVLVLLMVLSSFSMAGEVYTVKSGDVLWKIARTYGTTWQKLAEINKLKNPHLIFPNQKIVITEDEVKPEQPKPEKPKEPEIAKTIQILHTNDMHGFFIEGKYDGMGAAKLKTAMETKKAENANTLVLDAGDAMQGANLVTLSDGATAVKVLNALGYDAMTAGNHEFDYGLETLMVNKAGLEFPMVVCNVTKEDGTPLLDPYIIKEVDGIKVAIVGFATPETTYKSHPDNTKGLKFEAPAEAAKRVVKELEGKADILVGVGHLGEEGEYPASTVAEVGGFAVIVDGHSHSTYEEGMLVADTLIVSAGEKTKNLGVVTLGFDKDNKLVSKKATLVTKDMAAEIEPDAEVAKLIEEIRAENAKIEEVVVAKTDVVLNGERVFVRTGETNLGNILTASLLDVSKADVALTNGGGIRASIEVGDITKGEILTVLPFGNTVRVIELTGADLKAAIENGVKGYPEPSGGFPHIAGMTVEFDATKEAGSRVTSLKVNGEEVVLDKVYTLATNDFLVAGGDDYKMFKGKKVVGEYGAMDEVMIDFMAANPDYKAEVTGRIKEITGVEPNTAAEH